jgi:hypothetical protein
MACSRIWTLGLFVGKQFGVFGAVVAAVKLGIAQRPAHAGWWHLYGLSLHRIEQHLGRHARERDARIGEPEDWQHEVGRPGMDGAVCSGPWSLR